MEHTGGAARPKWQFTGYQVTHSDVSVTDSQGQTIDKTEASDDSWLIKKDGVYDELRAEVGDGMRE